MSDVLHNFTTTWPFVRSVVTYTDFKNGGRAFPRNIDTVTRRKSDFTEIFKSETRTLCTEHYTILVK